MDEANIILSPSEKYQIYARKYRPQILDDLLGQPAVVSALKNSLSDGHIPHSFLFAGPRGVGKTSAARILAKSLNCRQGISAVPCNKCDNCREITESRSIDVLEIDGASHTGVDNIRDLKEKAYNKPVQSRYKLYVVDEVHMLSQSAFNALLKILEEPPAHLVFIFATTEAHKIPETIHSRCQIFRFQRINHSAIITALQKVISNEKDLEIEPDNQNEILTLLSEESAGSLRDALVLLEQVALFSAKKLSLTSIQSFFSYNIPEKPSLLLEKLFNKNVSETMNFLHNFFQQGGNFELLVEHLLKEIRIFTLVKSGIRSREFLTHLQKNYPREVLDTAARRPLSFFLYISNLLLKTQEQLKFYQNPLFLLEITALKILYFSGAGENSAIETAFPAESIKESEGDYTSSLSDKNKSREKEPPPTNNRNLTDHILNNCFQPSKQKKTKGKTESNTFVPENFSKEEAWLIITEELKKNSQIGHNLLTFCQLLEIKNQQCRIGICPNHEDKASLIIKNLKAVFKRLGLPNMEIYSEPLKKPIDEFHDLDWKILEDLPEKYWQSIKTIQNVLHGKFIDLKQIKKEIQDGELKFQ